MPAKLIIKEGPNRGSIHSLVEDKTIIGRDASNTLAIVDRFASRQHCEIARREVEGEEEFWIKDLDSKNDTIVNGIPIVEKKLDYGDEIRVGESLMDFLPDETQEISGHLNDIQQEERETRTAAMLAKTEAVYLRDDFAETQALEKNERAMADLQTLYRVANKIHAISDQKLLFEKVLDLTFEAVAADIGAIFLFDNNGELAPYAMRRRDADSPQKMRVSLTITRQAIQSGMSILTQDAAADTRFSKSSSIASELIQSALCVPLQTDGPSFGVLYLDARTAVEAFDDYDLQLVTAIAHHLSLAVENLESRTVLEEEKSALERKLNLPHEIIGHSEPMKEVFEFISRVAPTNSTVLLLGKSGTGKELVARAIHANSPRKNKEFVPVNCAALTETLLESELFGHEKGAFTGAMSKRLGRFELADGSTIFLDEIGEMSPTAQTKLLRVLEDGVFERVGGQESQQTDVRCIAATNKNLAEQVQEGKFREDLFYRLNVICIQLPPLRDRKDDIADLVQFLFHQSRSKISRKLTTVSKEALELMVNYDWPGNVRELKNCIERAVVLCKSEMVMPEDLPTEVQRGSLKTTLLPSDKDSTPSQRLSLKDVERQHIIATLNSVNGNRTKAAKILGISKSTLYSKLNEYELE